MIAAALATALAATVLVPAGSRWTCTWVGSDSTEPTLRAETGSREQARVPRTTSSGVIAALTAEHLDPLHSSDPGTSRPRTPWDSGWPHRLGHHLRQAGDRGGRAPSCCTAEGRSRSTVSPSTRTPRLPGDAPSHPVHVRVPRMGAAMGDHRSVGGLPFVAGRRLAAA
ncbi:hypothetical protein QJS66_01110 [Kocuria rhizophila]|nr:hypothetical protein QJS66_01110 [Kocuria rhizophila]